MPIVTVAVIHDLRDEPMRKIITIAAFLAVALLTTAWSTSMLPRSNPAASVGAHFGGGGFVPVRSPALW